MWRSGNKLLTANHLAVIKQHSVALVKCGNPWWKLLETTVAYIPQCALWTNIQNWSKYEKILTANLHRGLRNDLFFSFSSANLPFPISIRTFISLFPFFLWTSYPFPFWTFRTFYFRFIFVSPFLFGLFFFQFFQLFYTRFKLV